MTCEEATLDQILPGSWAQATRVQSIIRIFTEAAPRPALVTATMWYEYEPLLTSAKLRASTPPRVNKKYSLENIVPSYHTRENIGRHTYSVVLKFFVERTDFTKSLMSTKKQLNIIVNKKQRT